MKLIHRSSRSFSRRTVEHTRPAMQTSQRAPRPSFFDRPAGTRPSDFSSRPQDARR